MRLMWRLLVLAACAFPSTVPAEGFDPTMAERPVWSPDGSRVAFSGADGRGVHVYDRHTGELLTITDTASSGYAVRFTPDGRSLAFKLFVSDSRRTFPWHVPALFDLHAQRLVPLGGPTARAGVPSVAASGETAVTEGEYLLLLDAERRLVARHHLGTYANLAPLAPGGDLVAYNDDQDAIWVLETRTGRRTRVTGEGAWYNPVWSPDGRRLLLHGISGRLACFDLERGLATELPRAQQAAWFPDGETLVYASASVPDVRAVPESDLYTIRCDGQAQAALTRTPGVHESFPAVSPDGRLLVYRVLDQGLVVAPLGDDGSLGPARPLLADLRSTAAWHGSWVPPPSPAELVPYAITAIEGVTYLHQVYDTPNDFNGHWACNATSAMMTIAWRGILPPWDCTVSVPTPHVSHFGRYVSQIYEYGGHRFSESSADPDGVLAYGGYGYITRNDWADTKGYMRDYLRIHGLESEVDWSPSWEKVKSEIDDRQPFVVLSSITTAGHYTVAIGYYTDQHTIVFNDPYGDKNAGYMNYDGAGAAYDWPGYNNGLANLNTVHCFIWSRAPAPGTLTGVVTDADSGLPLAAAAVALDNGVTAQTGPDGAYSFDGLFPRSYAVTASAPCHAAASATATVTSGGTAALNLTLTDDGSCGALRGTVSDAASGMPIQGATVALQGAAPLTTGPDGVFAFPHLAAGDYQLSASAPCHATANASATVTAGQTTTVDIGLHADGSCGATGRIEGGVTDETGAPIADATVSLDGGVEARTDEAGRYAFVEVAPGSHTVTAKAACYAEATLGVTVAPGGTATADLTLSAIAGCTPQGNLQGGCGCVIGASEPASGVGAFGPLMALALAMLILVRRRR